MENLNKIYIASKTKHAGLWRALRSNGANIISTWIDEADKSQSRDLKDLAVRCIKEAVECDVCILFCEANEIMKMAMIEFGAALGAGKRCIVVGECPSLESETLYHHPNVEKMLFEDFTKFMQSGN